MVWIKRAWRGEERLWIVFWVYCALPLLVINNVAGNIVLPAESFDIVGPVLFAGMLLYSVWCNVSLWFCAFNSQWRVWGYLIRATIIVMLFFLGWVDYTEYKNPGQSAENILIQKLEKWSLDIKGNLDAKEDESKNTLDVVDAPTSLHDTLQEQIAKCWKNPEGVSDTQYAALVRVEVIESGEITDMKLVDEIGRYNTDDNYRLVADSALEALRHCSPFMNLPVEKFHEWKSMELTFDPSLILSKTQP